MPVTIIDVAKRAGVSPSTVSRVIAGHPRISQETSKRVKEIMLEMGYHPNSAAKNLVSKKTNMLGMVVPRPAEYLFSNLFFTEFVRGVVTKATRSGYDLMLISGTNEIGELEAITRVIKERRVDGLILMNSRKEDPVLPLLKQNRFPFVLIGRNEDHEDILTVDNDNVQAAYEATQHLIARGHNRIGFVSGPKNLMVSMDRMLGYRQALSEAKLEMRSEWIVEGDFLLESSYMAMSLMMNLSERPTALIVIDDLVAFGILRGLTRLGYRVPHDMAIVSFNNITFSEQAAPPLSSVDIGIYQLGYIASQSLISFINGDHGQQQRYIIPHRLMIRESSTPTVDG